MELYFFWVWNDNSSLVNCLPKRFLLSELLKFWDKKHTSSLVWYVVCIENVYFSICRCVCSNRWDFQFLVSSSFLFQRFLVAVIDNLIFSLLRSLDPLHMLWHMTFHTALNHHWQFFYVDISMLLWLFYFFILGSSSLWSESILFCIFLLLSYYIRSVYFSCHTCIVYHICSPLSDVQYFLL